MTKHCPHCGTELPASATICPACGFAFSQRRKFVHCRHCGAKVPADLALCPVCGRALQKRWLPFRVDRRSAAVALLAVLLAVLLWRGQSLLNRASSITWPWRLERKALVISGSPVVMLLLPSATPTPVTPTPLPALSVTVTPYRPPTRVAEPTPLQHTITYIVQKGDTPENIARQWETSLAALLAANKLTRDAVIHVGDKLIVPLPTATPTSTPTLTPSPVATPTPTPSATASPTPTAAQKSFVTATP